MTLHSIEPAARIITAIGRDLIKDIPAAVVELVKNSYDADASFIEIVFSRIDDNLKIVFNDDGHGMDKDTIIGTWLVPGTDYKLLNKKSPKKRPFQGRKGIGRYAAAILGNELELKSIQNGVKTIAKIDWNEFETKQYLKDVKVSVETKETKLSNGTKLIIKGGLDSLNVLTEKEIKNIIRELRKLVSPLENNIDDSFKIFVQFENFYEDQIKNTKMLIEPFPILELYNYRLEGHISENGEAILKYENAYKNPPEIIEFNKKFTLNANEAYCGNIKLDFRVFDKDDSSIDFLIDKMHKNFQEENIGRRFVRQLLKESTGVGIYRNGFRIRPHGDPGFDWLNLDNRRVQNPSMRIGLDSIAGFVAIESEENSFLEEKSARDGLKESRYYNGLISLIQKSLSLLEQQRFEYRKNNDKNKIDTTAKGTIQTLFDFKEFHSEINKSLNMGLDKIKNNPLKVEEYTNEMKKTVELKIQSLEKQKSKEYEQIKEIIAIYQGQATLGKIVSVILHEGRKSLGWFSNQLPRIIKWSKKLGEEENLTNPLLSKIIDRLITTENESNSLRKLFNKLDPLTINRRSKPNIINLKEITNHVYEIFENELKYSNIMFEVKSYGNTKLFGVKEDFLMSLTNLIENSIYWLKKESIENKKIFIKIIEDDAYTVIEVIDNGPGIEKEFIENDVIFIPGFSGKSESSGTGLGLAIAGEAINRNNGELKAIYSEKGAHFRIEIRKVLGED
ncbi:ATP-binding protein [Niallia sp. Krafla_26]|uniref:ATP-binding protein n=1 Tax=Niallia sp. Krafla_26 TaxID=3064703 RepID=UPI003D174BC2